MTARLPSGCHFCDDGGCLLCQLRAPVEVGVSSSHGVLVDMSSGNMGDGNSHTTVRGRGAGDSPPPGLPTTAADDHHFMSTQHHCPLCGMDFKDLFHHYSQHHPGVRAHAARGSLKV